MVRRRSPVEDLRSFGAGGRRGGLLARLPGFFAGTPQLFLELGGAGVCPGAVAGAVRFGGALLVIVGILRVSGAWAYLTRLLRYWVAGYQPAL